MKKQKSAGIVRYLPIFLANDSNFDRNPLRGCNYGLEGGIFDFRGVQFFAKGRGAPS